LMTKISRQNTEALRAFSSLISTYGRAPNGFAALH
jgi:hypothetical protein